MKRRDFIQSATLLAAYGAVNGLTTSCGNSAGQTVSKRELGKTGFQVYPVGYGGIVSMNDGQEASDRYVSYAIDHGINYFDVAPSYGDAEEKMGNSLIPYRKNVYLACKTVHRMREEAEPEFEKSFERLHTDYFDVYQLHAINKQEDIDKAFGPGGIMDMLVHAKQAGRIRKLGVTAHSEEFALKAMSMYDFDTVMFPVNWMMNMLNGMGAALCNDAKKREMGVIAIKSLVHRNWLDRAERNNSEFKKPWCKPIDVENTELGVAALKYALRLGVDLLIPPGEYKCFSFVVDHLDEIMNRKISSDETALLENEFTQVRDYPFFS